MDKIHEYIKNSNNPYFKDFYLNDVELKIPDYVEPSKLRTSTMTYTANINVTLDLQLLFDNIILTDNYPKIISCEYGNNDPKGDVKKKKKYFANQLTLKILYDDNFKVNMKIFNNGKIGITGCKDNNITLNILNFIIEYIININKINKFVSNIDDIKLNNLNIVLINSDFRCGFQIKRNEFYNILKKLNLYVTYEPDTYAGVKLCFFYNKIYNDDKLGICYCNKKCKGKGNGDGIGECKKITIAIFQSGSIIITGARCHEQKEIAYNFINSIVKKNYKHIFKQSIDNSPIIKIKDNKLHYKIHKSNIINYHLKNQ